MFQQGGKASHLDNIAVPLHSDHVDGLAAASLHIRPVCGAPIIIIRAGILADENRPVARPVVPLIKQIDELIR